MVGVDTRGLHHDTTILAFAYPTPIAARVSRAVTTLLNDDDELALTRFITLVSNSPMARQVGQVRPFLAQER